MGKVIKRLLCFGDSFVADSRIFYKDIRSYMSWSSKHWGTNEAWIDELCGKLNISKVGHVGKPGTGPSDVFWQLSNFLASSELTENDLVIITWSQFRRSLDAGNNPLRGFAEYDPVNEPNMVAASKLYFKHIYNENERFNAYNMSVNAVDNLLRNTPATVLHFYCFRDEFMREIPDQVQPFVKQTYTPQVGHVCEEFNLSDMAAKHYQGDKPDHSWWCRPEGDEHPNHLGPLANEQLINYIMDRL